MNTLFLLATFGEEVHKRTPFWKTYISQTISHTLPKRVRSIIDRGTAMGSQGYSRKRPAPGADPVPYPPQMQNPVSYNDGLGTNLSNDEFFQWGQTGQPAVPYNDNSYTMNTNTYPQNNPQPQPSNQLTRRPMTQLAAPTRPRMDQDGNAWMDNTNGAHAPDAEWGDDIAVLEARAQIAKRDAQAKRKQIPPFVQKLNR